MFIEPSSNIKLLKNVPLDNTYNHTIYFDLPESQTDWFASKVKHNLTRNSYQRVNKSVMRISLEADQVYDCNYLMFQNTGFGNKWFYAFIKSVEYVNNAVTEISYEIDIMQTWMFDYTLKQCLVEREHTEYDYIGYNIIPEPLETGEYVVSDYKPLSNSMTDTAIVVAICDTDGEESKGNVYDGVYSGCTLYAYREDDYLSVNKKIANYLRSPDSIIGMYMCPSFLIDAEKIPDGGKALKYSAHGLSLYVGIDKLTGTEDFQGYVPSNKKLYTYPYNYFCVDNASGNTLPLRYEFFDNEKPRLRIFGSITQPVRVATRPLGYKGTQGKGDLTEGTALNTESITLESYPVCSWNYDTYKAWVSQNSVPICLNNISTGIGTMSNVANSTIIGMAGGNPVSSAINGVTGSISAGASRLQNAIGVLSQVYTASIKADTCRGTVNNGTINFGFNYQQFFCSRTHITEDYCRMIDSFFSMFGYAVNRLKVPNFTSRPHWNYVKTSGCVITGSVPADDMNGICKIFDRGVTFWKNGNEVGNYALNNPAPFTSKPE